MFIRAFEEFERIEAENVYGIRRLKDFYADFLQYAKRDLRKAIEFYRSAYDDGKSVHSMISLAKALRAAGENKEAEKVFKSALSQMLRGSGAFRKIKNQKKNGDACSDYRIGECYFGMKQYKKSKEHLERAVLRAEGNADCPKKCCFEAIFTLALIALDEGDREKARELYRQVLDTVNDRDYREAAPLFE